MRPTFCRFSLLALFFFGLASAQGSFVAINNTVSQSVPHFHIHIVPRRKGDGLRGFFWPRQKYEDVELDAVQQALLSRAKT